MRELGDGVSEVITLSWWTSEEDLRAFAGEDYRRARYYPEDDRILQDRAEFVDHFRVVAATSATPAAA